MNFDELIIHPTTRRQLENYLRVPTHALLLTGEDGVGLGTIAKILAQKITGRDDKSAAGTEIATIAPTFHDKQKTRIINADDMRDLFDLTRLRRANNFAIVIDDADLTAAGVFERILKLLEEPVANVFYILTSHRPERLPATILSRAQQIEILPPRAEDCEKIFENQAEFIAKVSGYTNKKIPKQVQNDKMTKIKFLADRKPAEIVRLLDEEYFRNAAVAMESAKTFVQGNVIDRLKIVAETTTRGQAIQLAKNVAKLVCLIMPRAKNVKIAAENLTMIATILDNLHQNGNVRAQLTCLALNI